MLGRPILAVDFDGTITKYNEYPHCGAIREKAAEVLQDLHSRGCIIILWTCRDDENLLKAIDYCVRNEIPIDYANCNTKELREAGFTGPKIFANYYIDDLNLGGFPGWEKVREIVLKDPYFLPYES